MNFSFSIGVKHRDVTEWAEVHQSDVKEGYRGLKAGVLSQKSLREASRVDEAKRSIWHRDCSHCN